jgi:hypothetical protein
VGEGIAAGVVAHPETPLPHRGNRYDFLSGNCTAQEQQYTDYSVHNLQADGSVFQFQYPSRTNGGTDSATYTTGPDNIFTPLSIAFYIYPHFAVLGAVAARNALPAVGGYPEPRPAALYDTHYGCLRTSESAPYPTAEYGVKSGTYYPGKHGSNEK